MLYDLGVKPSMMMMVYGCGISIHFVQISSLKCDLYRKLLYAHFFYSYFFLLWRLLLLVLLLLLQLLLLLLRVFHLLSICGSLLSNVVYKISSVKHRLKHTDKLTDQTYSVRVETYTIFIYLQVLCYCYCLVVVWHTFECTVTVHSRRVPFGSVPCVFHKCITTAQPTEKEVTNRNVLLC